MIEFAENNEHGPNEDEMDRINIMLQELKKELKYDRDMYTEEQIKEIGILKGRYDAIVFKKGVIDFRESLMDMGNEIEGFIEGLSAEVSE